MEPGTVTQLRWRPAVTFAARLRLIRLDYSERLGRRVNQEEMALLLGVKAGTYKSWEAGNSRPSDLITFAQHLYEVTGADPAWLLDVAEPSGPDTPGGQDLSPTRWLHGRVVDLGTRRSRPEPLAA